MIDRQDLQQALATLRRGGIILYPTDTVWGIGCDATNAEAVSRIYQLKRRSDSKAMICLLSDVSQIERYVGGAPEVAYQLVEVADKPLTVIYDDALVPPLAANLPAEDGTVALRITHEEFSSALCRELRKPLVSTSANLSGEPTARTFAEISQEIISGVDYVCTSGRDSVPAQASAIIKLTASGCVTVIR
jgi:L-threonylcarbamoyladenylate synthase